MSKIQQRLFTSAQSQTVCNWFCPELERKYQDGARFTMKLIYMVKISIAKRNICFEYVKQTWVESMGSKCDFR